MVDIIMLDNKLTVVLLEEVYAGAYLTEGLCDILTVGEVYDSHNEEICHIIDTKTGFGVGLYGVPATDPKLLKRLVS